MGLAKIVIRNTLRQKLRTVLTVLGMAVAILAFCLLDTVVDVWYSGVAGASPDRLVCRHAVSLTFTLPISHRQRIMQVSGVRRAVYANWFGGIYIDERNFFPRMAVGPKDFFELFPEFIIPSDQLKAFWSRRNACLAGRKLIEKYGWKIGDTVTMTGNIYPGEWRFVLQGVYRGATKSVDETQFFFQWDYLDEMVKKIMPSQTGMVGWYIVQVANPMEAGTISHAIDALFENSWAETLTETEKAFQLGFVSMTEAILIAVRVVSYVVIAVILVILANTMAMTSRERMPEYATLKTLGFGNGFLAALIAGESVLIALLGGIAGTALSFPAAAAFSKQMGTFLPFFNIQPQTVAISILLSMAIGLLSAVIPTVKAVKVGVVEALGHIG